uniref:Pseudouridine synthase n=1 Tax=uncultured marine group II/III euryarchaeote KM3_183_H08 TaxID=1457947 RepID=A0A075GNF3_9EURY|nr:Pseudouridine synthase [uncultured marine group II/III euryarchaeote KM3_183_H08]
MARPGVVRAQKGVSEGSIVLIKSLKDEAVSVARLSVDSDSLPGMMTGEVAVSRAVIMEPGTYPQSWSKE